MKIYNALKTESLDGNVNVEVKPFAEHTKAMEWLFKEYLDIKAENSEDEKCFVYDYVDKTSEESCNEFYLEDEVGTFWWSGSIQIADLEYGKNIYKVK